MTDNYFTPNSMHGAGHTSDIPDSFTPMHEFIKGEFKAGPGTNTGHGHLWERPDGVKARCGGPYLCTECRSLIPEYGTTDQKTNLAYKKQREDAEIKAGGHELLVPDSFVRMDPPPPEDKPRQLCTVDDIIIALNKVNASPPVRVVFCNPAEYDGIIQALMDRQWIGVTTPNGTPEPDKIIVRASHLVEYGTTYVADGPDPYKAAPLSWNDRLPVT